MEAISSVLVHFEQLLGAYLMDFIEITDKLDPIAFIELLEHVLVLQVGEHFSSHAIDHPC